MKKLETRNDNVNVYRDITSPLVVSFEITSNCNARCIHCYGQFGHYKNCNDNLDEDKVSRIINELLINKVFHVIVTGGEPLLDKNNTLFFLRMAQKLGISCSLNSNLMNLDAETSKELKSLGIRNILTSLASYDLKTHDKITQGDGNYKKVLNGIECAQKHGLNVSINMVLHKQNIDHVYKTAEFVSSLGVKNFSATKASTPEGLNEFISLALNKDETIKSLKDLIKAKLQFDLKVNILECYPLCLFPDDKEFNIFTKRRCTAGVTACCIKTNGSVTACTHSNKSYGNIFIQPLDQIWDNMTEWRSGELLPPKCLNCKYFRICSGGCRVEASLSNKNDGMDPLASNNNVEYKRLLEEIKADYYELSINDKIRFSKEAMHRKEEFGYIFCKGFNVIYTTKETGDILIYLSSKNEFNIFDVANELNIPEDDLMVFIKFLIKKSIIEIIK